MKRLRTTAPEHDATGPRGAAQGQERQNMPWRSTLADGDAVIVRETAPDGARFVVHGRGGPEFRCRSYTEAELLAVAYASGRHAHAWIADVDGLHLITDT